MPNWCNNVLEINGDKESVQKFLEQAKGNWKDCPTYAGDTSPKNDEEDTLLFWKFVPPPQEILDKGYSSAGYDWEHEAWGCKWGASDTNCDSGDDWIQYVFDTPWCPPIEFLEAVAKMYPTLTFELDYNEDGNGLHGSVTFAKGKLKKRVVAEYRESKFEDEE